MAAFHWGGLALHLPTFTLPSRRGCVAAVGAACAVCTVWRLSPVPHPLAHALAPAPTLGSRTVRPSGAPHSTAAAAAPPSRTRRPSSRRAVSLRSLEPPGPPRHSGPPSAPSTAPLSGLLWVGAGGVFMAATGAVARAIARVVCPRPRCAGDAYCALAAAGTDPSAIPAAGGPVKSKWDLLPDPDPEPESPADRYLKPEIPGCSAFVYREADGSLKAGCGHVLTPEEAERYQEGDVVDDDTIHRWMERDGKLEYYEDEEFDGLNFSSYVTRSEEGVLVAGFGHVLTPKDLKRWKEGDRVDCDTVLNWYEEDGGLPEDLAAADDDQPIDFDAELRAP